MHLNGYAARIRNLKIKRSSYIPDYKATQANTEDDSIREVPCSLVIECSFYLRFHIFGDVHYSATRGT